MPLGNSGINPGLESSNPARELQDAVRGGASFSGNERHVVFRNGGGVYKDVSGITGLDLPDDGRAACFTDWDGDGDLDLWVSNRSGPQVRYFENQNPSGGASLTLTLIGDGERTNRDAIGARVELQVEDQLPQRRFVSAGSGFLAQSSKTLHFGLGKATTTRSLTIHWPGQADPQIIKATLAAGHYVIEQGQAPRAAKRLDPPTAETQPAQARPDRTILAAPFPVATLVPRPAGTEGKPFVITAEEQPAEQLALLQIIHDHPFDIKDRVLAKPPSFLIDADDHLRVIYHAQPSTDQVDADIGNLLLANTDPRLRSLPFPGRWQSKAIPAARPLSLVEDLLDAGLLDVATRYIKHHQKLLASDPAYQQLIGRLQLLRSEAAAP